MELKEFIHKLRLSYNYTQIEMSEKIGITQSTYSQIESGKRKPSFQIVRKISKFSGMTEEEIRKML